MTDSRSVTTTERDEQMFRIGYLAALSWAVHDLARAVEALPVEAACMNAADSFTQRMRMPPSLVETLQENR